VNVETAEQMFAAVQRELPGTAIFVGTAAVADYRPATIATAKIKKTAESMALDMVRTTDILAWVAARGSERPFVVGFAAETDAIEQHAREKLLRKNLDMIAANEVGEYKAFDCDDNALLVLWRGGRAELPRAAKADLAAALAALIVARYAEQPALSGRSSAKG
jgi:phosphopantothenoylcysteine decarboxylase/phosphopantothenate--cysteine ligase